MQLKSGSAPHTERRPGPPDTAASGKKMAKAKKVNELKELEKKILSGELEGEKAMLLVQLAIARQLEDIKDQLHSIKYSMPAG